MESIKDKVAIVGMGLTKFKEHWDKGFRDLIIDATYEAYEDAGLETKDIQMAWMGTVMSGLTALSLSVPLKLDNIPVTRVENMCCSGSEALRGACYAVAAGVCDVALAVGFEKLKDTGFSGVPAGVIGESLLSSSGVEPDLAPVALYALLATGYAHRYGLTPEELKRSLALIAVKNHHNGAMSPKAHFQKEITLEQALNAPIIAWPLGLFDCCGVSDGAAAAIVTRADMAKNFRDDPIYVKALSVVAGNRSGLFQTEYDYSWVEQNAKAAEHAYADAGVKDPLKEINLAEVHDCFTIHEMSVYEDFGWCPRGTAKDYVENGAFNLDGELAVNSDGGLKCFGHPLGASGLRMMYEVYKQLQGKAGPRQRKNPQLGLAHNAGGVLGGSLVSTAFIVGNSR
ncbi:MAG: acetyl-CoA acetyltransferase [Chloroflexota bacterium]|nr:acetyl-CoA acetyltransferase [Chloroflexota bacterium]